MIPGNIHTIPWAVSWNSEGEGKFVGLEFCSTVWNSKHIGEWVGGGVGMSSEFIEGETDNFCLLLVSI